ncbi:MAG TPA: hypothetical protein VK184_15270 [Nostocaceae cyanobacterium]|nr:hypothetical protein [Nostocaceae cyanobacterium]
MQSTPDYLEILESCGVPYLDILSKFAFRCLEDEKNSEQNQNNQNKLFQILIINDKSTNESEIKLVYGNKDFFKSHYDGIDTENLPTKGAIVDKQFARKDNDNYPLIRHLLQSRKLCQMMASTWIDFDQDHNFPPSFCNQVKYVKKIFDSYNISPCTYWENKKITSTIELKRKLLEEGTVPNTNLLIKPGSIGYSSISLALLLSGQVYYVDKVEKIEGRNKLSLKKVWKPILSTYEIVYGYAMDLSWDTFCGTISEISQAVNRPKLPLSKITLGYPPKPSEFYHNDHNIRAWSLASDSEEEDDDTIKNNEYPFYPPKNSDEWKDQKPRFVVPPFPYLPLSSL